MSRKQFYEINSETYLFPSQSAREGDQNHPEEPVRQWCAFELIRAYGIAVPQFEFECPVRVGSKTYRIDLLVKRDSVPWLVVECKQPQHKKHKEAIQQAISYAGAQEIQAEFALYTNGHEWQVQQRISEQWVAVPDLPVQLCPENSKSITDILLGMESLAPLLYKLDEVLEGNDAHGFLSAMQVFFNGVTLFTHDANSNLLSATDNLLRAVIAGDLHPEYRIGKLETARHRLSSYFSEAGIEIILPPVRGESDISYEMQMMYAATMRVAEVARSLSTVDAYLLRLHTAILDYGRLLRSAKQHYPKLNVGLQASLRDYLNCVLAIRLNAALPDPIDHISINDMKAGCQDAWERRQKDESSTVSFRELFSPSFWV